MERWVKLTETVKHNLNGLMLARYVDLLWDAAYRKTDGLNVGDVRTSYRVLSAMWGVSAMTAKRTVEHFAELDLATVTPHGDSTLIHLKQFDVLHLTNSKPSQHRDRRYTSRKNDTLNVTPNEPKTNTMQRLTLHKALHSI